VTTDDERRLLIDRSDPGNPDAAQWPRITSNYIHSCALPTLTLMSPDEDGFRGMERRRYLGTVTLADLAGLAGRADDGGDGDGGGGDGDGEGSDGGDGGSGPNYSVYQDVSITFATSSLYTEPWNDLASRFTDETGIDVEVTASRSSRRSRC
jgi:hypothetical protein